MSRYPITPPRIKHGRLRIFANVEEAIDYEWAHPQSNKISVLAGDHPTLRWRLFRCLSTRREQRLRNYLYDGTGCAFAVRDHGGIAHCFDMVPIKVVASTICQITGAKP